MRHLKTTLLAATIAAVTLALFATAATNVPDGSIARFRLIEKSHSTLGAFPGSTETWHMGVLLVHATSTIGTAVITCTQIKTRPDLRQCSATYQLPKGQLELQGLITTDTNYTLLIVGASGVYQGNEGSAATQQIGRAPWSGLITFYFS